MNKTGLLQTNQAYNHVNNRVFINRQNKNN